MSFSHPMDSINCWREPTIVAAILTVIVTAVLTLATFYFQEKHLKEQRTLQMHSYIVENEFMKAINNLLDEEYKFRCTEKLNRMDINKSAATKFFWRPESVKIDEYLFIIYGRLDAVARCSKDLCDTDLLYTIFPIEVIQAVEYMMPYFRYRDDEEGMTWYFENHVLKFIEKYKEKINKINGFRQFPSWSSDHYEPYPGFCSAYTKAP